MGIDFARPDRLGWENEATDVRRDFVLTGTMPGATPVLAMTDATFADATFRDGAWLMRPRKALERIRPAQ
jgi:hypothetical protein